MLTLTVVFGMTNPDSVPMNPAHTLIMETKESSGLSALLGVAFLAITYSVIFSAAYWIAFCLRFDFDVPNQWQDTFWITLPWLLAIQLSCFAAFGNFNDSCRDTINLAYPLLIGFLTFALLDFFVFEFHIPRGIHLLNLLIAMTLIASLRSIWRISKGGVVPHRVD